MRIDAGQYQRMSQQMKLSPRMIQSMEILQLSTMALEERIEEELESNPLLELTEVKPEESHEVASASSTPEEERPMVAHDSDSGDSTRDDFNRLDEMSDSQSDTWEANVSESGEYRPSVRYDSSERDGKLDAMANTAARDLPLTDQLLDQWRFIEVPPPIKKAGEHLINFIDDDGYMRTSMQDVVLQAPSGVTIPLLGEALEQVQRRLEPAGIGARDVRETLLLQLDALVEDESTELDELDVLELARLLVADHLKDVEMNRLPKIAQQTGRSMDDINAALHRLRRLDPRPGRQLAPATTSVIVPDVIIEYDPVNDTYVAALNRGRQPSLRINPSYRKLGKDRGQEKSTREFVARNLSNARWLIDSIEQRNNTLLRVVNAVLQVQRDFLDHGEQHLKPLPMVQVADQLGIHVGTVSRAVSEKYLQTPRGIFPLRMLFSGGTESASGDQMSWTAVQHKLKEVVDSEDKSDPLSDDALAEKLSDMGIDIARRTVAKYRKQLGIGTARQRRAY